MSGDNPAPGWYADATDPSLIRWWDGSSWSEHTQPNPAAASGTALAEPAPPAPAAPAPAPSPAIVAPAPSPSTMLDDVPPSSGFAAAGDFAAPGVPLVPADANPGEGSRRTTRSTSLPISEPVRLVPPSYSPPAAQPEAGATESEHPGAAPSGFAAPSFGAPSFGGPSFGAPAFDAAPFDAAPFDAPAPFAGGSGLAPAAPGSPSWSSTPLAAPSSAADMASVDYEPLQRSWGHQRSGPLRQATGVSTGGAWMLALSPLLGAGLSALVWALTDGGTSAATPLVALSVVVVALLWLLLGAIADYRRLGVLGHEFRPSVAWILLGPFFYLLVRAVHVYRTMRRGVAPTWVYIVLSVVVGIGVSVGSLFLPREATSAELRTVESTIVAELAEQGVTYTVMCPETAPAGMGTSFVCTAYDEVGPAAVIRVTWSSVPGVFEYALETGSATS